MGIVEMLEREIAAWEMVGAPVGQNLKAAVLKHGRAYEVDREATAARIQGALGECFSNAANAVIEDKIAGREELTYVEGFAHRGGIVVHHAWVINADGKVLELTWRDGGTECGYCVEGEIDQEFDEDDVATWEPIPCPHCGGTGESDYEHYTLEHAEYFGIEVDTDTMVKIVKRRGVYGALNTQRDLDEILAARKR
jgi:hypothetical protein